MKEKLISVIIPTYNSAEFLENCLKSIKAQTYKNIEIIIVDKFSTDKTKEIAHQHGAVVIDSASSMSEARNVGAKKSKGEFILSVDADMELTPSVVEEAVKNSEEYDSLIIPEMSFGEGFWAKCKALEKECYLGDDTMESARFFKKGVFYTVKGYDDNLLFGEDKDMDIRIREEGFKVGRIEAQIRHNEGRLSLWNTMKKKYNYGKTLHLYKNKHKSKAKKQFALIRPAFVGNWNKLINNPTYAFSMFFMKFCEACATIAGLMSTKKR